MITLILIILAVLIAGVLAVAASKPNTFRIQRAAVINAPREMIFPLINDLRQHRSWSPFDKNPGLKRVHSGAENGTGAVYEWEGDRKAGAGRIAITQSLPSKIVMALDMLRPFKCHNTVEFTFEPRNERTDDEADECAGAATGVTTTKVTWLMHGPQPFMAKLVNTFIDCEKMVGRQFEEGLGNLKTLAERG